MPSPPVPVAPLPYDGVRAPDFPVGFPWLNSPPLSLQALRGKVVLLDFWTYGCINCQHILPELRKLELKYPQELVVIGVHSAKFVAESETAAVRQAVLRYGIEHPVVVDQNQRLWGEYAVRAWPTLVLIDPAGRVAGQVAGEGHTEVLDATIAHLIATARKRGTLRPSPLNLTLEHAQVAPTPLVFPGKIIATDEGEFFIADSGHNRIVRANREGRVVAVYGTGAAGLRDGSSDTAQFHNPQGMAYAASSQRLYIADTNNHAIRAIELRLGNVATLARQLSSPWDLVLLGEKSLIIAMAGVHQLWKLDLETGAAEVYAGSGAEGRYDASLAAAAFAQPSGIVALNHGLYVADAESSCIRHLDPQTQTVTTLAGGDLFAFGDRDGQGDAVRLQHPLGLTAHRDQLFIADTYNSKIKRLEIETGSVETVFAAGLNEPGGMAFDGEELYVADTNNHVIQKIDLSRKSATRFDLADLKPPIPIDETAGEEFEVSTSPTQFLAPDVAAHLVSEAEIPVGFHLNRAARLSFSARLSGSGLRLVTDRVEGSQFVLPLKLPLEVGQSGGGTLEIEAVISLCSEGDGAVCRVEIVRQRVPYEVREGGGREIVIALQI